MDSGGVLGCIASSEKIQSVEGESFSTFYTGQQPLGNLHSPPCQQIREVKTPSETEMEGDLEPHHRWGRAIKIDGNICSEDDLGNMTMLFKYLLLCKPKMSNQLGEGHREAVERILVQSKYGLTWNKLT